MVKIFLQTFFLLLPILINFILPVEYLVYILLDLWGITEESIKNITVSERSFSIICVSILIITIWWIIKTRLNKDKLFNTGKNYHAYPYFIYWYASKILGFESVSLERVPIYMQFKLILRDTFKETTFTKLTEGQNVETTLIEKNMNQNINEINLILIDTYEITPIEIPENKIDFPTVIIKSGNEVSHIRTVNNKFIGLVRKKSKKYEQLFSKINIFATTNTNHTYQIVNDNFKDGHRFGYEKIVVYQYSNTLNKFEKKYIVSKKKFI